MRWIVKSAAHFSQNVSSMNQMQSAEKILRELFTESVNSVQPYQLIRNALSVDERHLTVLSRTYVLSKPAKLVGFGKAVSGMAIAVEEVLGDLLQMGIVSIPEGSFNSDLNSKLKYLEKTKIEFLQGAKNNLPDEKSMKSALKIKNFVMNSDENDTIIVLISGGGSALLPLPKENISLNEKLDLIKKLGNRGADIFEMNCIRKELSQLKGGGLAKICYPAKVITLILSDVIGDPIDVIASGPTCQCKSNTEFAISILEKYSLFESLPKSILNVLEKNRKLKEEIPYTVQTDNFILGNNEKAAEAVLQKANENGFNAFILTTKISGAVETISKTYAEIAKAFIDYYDELKNDEDLIKILMNYKKELHLIDNTVILENLDRNRNTCLIFAGEPTVTVTGNGLGGRNQQLALSFSVELSKLQEQSSRANVFFLSCGTDGIDGPTDAAGAIGYSSLVLDSKKENLDPEPYLSNNDCYHFFKTFQDGRYLVQVGHTGTNVMDIHVMLINID